MFSRSTSVTRADDGTLQSIQALRGAAALLVTLFHAAAHFDPTQETFRVGNAGVDIFFVISGFVMWTTTLRRQPTPEIFLRHRIIRVFPLYALFTFALLAGWTAMPWAFPHMGAPTAEQVLLSLAFVPHFDPDGQIFPLLAQGWTLNFEMFFYLLFALGLMLPMRRRLEAAFAALLILPLLGLTVSRDLLRHAPVLVLLNPLLVEFLGGLTLAHWMWRGFRPSAALAWASLAAGVLALALLPAPAADANWMRLVFFGGPAFLIVAGAVSLEIGGRVKLGRLPLLLGASSYSLYLSHTFTLSLVGKVWPRAVAPFLFAPVASAASAAVGVAVYLLLERPLLSWLRCPKAPVIAARLARS
jgi:exopolysaccharide production protein ExoZ